MSVLDLQGMEGHAPQGNEGGDHSGSSTNSCPSDLSTALCGPHSVLSLILC
jgi:hypothetical protein